METIIYHVKAKVTFFLNNIITWQFILVTKALSCDIAYLKQTLLLKLSVCKMQFVSAQIMIYIDNLISIHAYYILHSVVNVTVFASCHSVIGLTKLPDYYTLKCFK